MGVAGAVAGTFGIQPLVGAFGVPYQAAEPRDERQIRVPLRIGSEMSQGGLPGLPGAYRASRGCQASRGSPPTVDQSILKRGVDTIQPEEPCRHHPGRHRRSRDVPELNLKWTGG